MADSTRIRLTDDRERHLDRLGKATGESTRSKAIDRASKFYTAMHGSDYSAGAFNELLEAAEERGSLTAPEIAEILDSPHLEVSASVEYSVGKE